MSTSESPRTTISSKGSGYREVAPLRAYGGESKPKVAAEHGESGADLFGSARGRVAPGDIFPAGPMRPPDGVQRGSVMDMPVYPGDPLTPGIGAVPGAKRLALSEVTTLTKIPVMPISYGDAQPLLAALRGPMAPATWRGGLPITYHVGPGPAKVHLKLKFNWDTKPLYDVIARIPGSTYPDEWIIRGNHHDAWVNGASDPLADRLKANAKPQRHPRHH